MKLKLPPFATVILNMVVTFVQAATAAWYITGFKTDKLAVAGAVGAGLSVVWNTIVKPWAVKIGLLKG